MIVLFSCNKYSLSVHTSFSMKKMLRIFDVFFKSTALLILIIGCSFLLIAVSPRQVNRGQQKSDPTIADYFEAESAEKIVTATGEMRLIVTVKDIETESMIVKCKLLAEQNRLKRLVVTFLGAGESVEIVIDENYDAYTETVRLP